MALFLKKFGLLLGILTFFILQMLDGPASMSVQAWDATSVVALVAIWWVTEALPLSVTALVPIALFPTLNVITIPEAARPYSSPLILLMIGGFMIALGMQRWNLHKRIALRVMLFIGSKPSRLVLGFMVASALISMWIFNTTTTVMMVPIALSVIELVKRDGSSPGWVRHNSNFAAAVMLGIAYGATIGGMCTLIGTAPNAILAGFMYESYGVEVSFLNWLMVGLPMGMVLLPTLWWFLVKVVFPLKEDEALGENPVIESQLKNLGEMGKGERVVATVVSVAAFLWVFRPWINEMIPFVQLSDMSIALGCGISLFLVPIEWQKGEFPLTADWVKKLPWDVVLLFGGGLSLAAGIKLSGLADWIGHSVSLFAALPVTAVVFGIVLIMILLTEFTSNTATTATFLPIAGSIAVSMGENPLLLIFPTVLAASCAFMMPVATPPNAVVFGSGQLKIGQFIKAGIYGNILGLIITMLIGFTMVRWVFGIELGVLPDWAIQ